MAKVERDARIIIKRSSISGDTATLAPISVNGNYDHTLLPEWKTTDIYIGELFLNEPDEKLWIRFNATTIKRVLMEGDVSGDGTSGTSGTSGTVTGVTLHNEFYYDSGNTTLYVPNIIASGITLNGLISSGTTNYLVSDVDGKIYKTNIGVTEDVYIGDIMLRFVNGLFTGSHSITTTTTTVI
jgi:hypothetical protein